MIKGTIKAKTKATTARKGILFYEEGANEEGARWFTCSDAAYNFAKRGSAEIDMDSNNLVTSVRMTSLAPSQSTPFARGSARPPSMASPSYNPERDRLIVRQSCLKAAVDLIGIIKPDDAHAELAMSMAAELEKWVFRSEEKEAEGK